MSEPASQLTLLPFGEGKIGRDKRASDELVASQLPNYLRPINMPKTADCVDGRSIVSMADGTNDPDVLNARIAHQLPGGLVLAVSKAAVASDLVVVRDAKSMRGAYETMHKLLADLGYQDGGHADCGASKHVENSVAKALDEEVVGATLSTLDAMPVGFSEVYGLNARTKQERLMNGFYTNWSQGWHEDFLSQRVPGNFAFLKEEDGELHGHYEQGVTLPNGPGFAKNAFNEEVGGSLFCMTLGTLQTLVVDLSRKVALSQRERQRFELEMQQDAFSVLNLLATNIPVF
ncbi:MAG TPA: hypothetical protein VL989_00015 [Candidatus Sulfotelmatobacter sp.]|nr:hypothetical protein [Candidatus Sulfotelmatobacter sp.]